MNLQGKKVLVTGADGFIGSHLADDMVRRGAEVRAFVLYNSFNSRGWLDSTEADVVEAMEEVVAGDVRDYHSVRQASEGVDVVFHLAALTAIPLLVPCSRFLRGYKFPFARISSFSLNAVTKL